MPVSNNSKQQFNSSPGSGSDTGGKESFQISAPSISLPKGGGAIRGMGEKFAANPVTGTGSMTVPIATSPGRSGFGPQLSLSYDSGAGNGPFGFGWSLSLPSITRKTDKGLPRYQDAVESDVFILSGAEDLVPVLVQNHGNWEREKVDPRPVDNQTYVIQRYRPRIEGLFARIEWWTNQKDPSDCFWRSISKDNITTWYGRTENSRIFDPFDPTRIFSWLICESYDDKGNVIVYQYEAENFHNVDLSQVHERNRTGTTQDKEKGSRTTNRYLKRIYYGNREPYLPKIEPSKPLPNPPGPKALDGNPNWFFEVVFDYDDGHYTEDKPDAEGRVFVHPVYDPQNAKWKPRVDPFSTYRAGFEVRTYRLCQRVLMFHHFPDELGVPDYLVRSTDFTYSYEDDPKNVRNPIYSFLDSVSQSGYVRQDNGSYLKKSLPPLQFEYAKPEVQAEVHDVDPQSLENLPYGLDGSKYQWVDLDGEGLSGILTEQGDAWFYKRNLSPLPVKTNGKEEVTAHFGPLELVAKKPSLAAISAGGQQFLDLAGDGQLDLVALSGPTPGFFERTQDEDWEEFKSFSSLPNVEWNNPNLKFVDLTGDGHADILITEDDVFWWHPSLAEDGFGPAERVPQNWDEEKGPRLVFADVEHTIHLADLSGDGLSDLVRIRNGEVCYWANLGYGRFGPKVTMDNAPWLDNPDQFDPRRIQLADIDGSGTTDIIYLGSKGIDLYFNQSGNSWSKPQPLESYPQTDNLSSVTAMDLLGIGTACLVWSSPLPSNAGRRMRYIDLMGGHKPHLLVSTRNNLGAETRVQYGPSTKFYLQDKRDGKPWISRLPFPVHVVERVETYDYISRNRFVTRYAFHHGYFDGVEREFRGFGMVEQFDTEEFATLSKSDAFPDATNIDSASHVPPVLTKTWFHTGAYIEGERISRHCEHEYYGAPNETDFNFDQKWNEFESGLLPDTVLPSGLTLDEEREACRALKGSMLRQEVYALDGTDKQQHPYTVTEQNFTMRTLQPQGANRHAVFFTHAREPINYHYERNPSDPRIQHALTLEVDGYGNVLKQAAIGYGRRMDAADAALLPEDRAKQRLIHITCTENEFTNAVGNEADVYRAPLAAQSLAYELRKPQQEKSGNGLTKLYRFEDIVDHVNRAGDGAHDIDYEDFEFARAKQAVMNDVSESNKYFRRLIEHVRTLYRPNDLGAAQNNRLSLLPLRTVQSLALPGESYKLAFTPGLLTQVFQRPHAGQQSEALLPDPSAVLGGLGGDRGGYVQSQTLKADGRFPNSDANDHWWIPSGRSFFTTNHNDSPAAELATAQQHFYLPRRYRNPFAQDTTVSFEHDLLLVESRDALDNVVKVEANDYRVLQPRLVSDPNHNRPEVAFDALGLVVGTAVMGKPSPAPKEGDSLAGFSADLTQTQIDAFHSAADPHTTAPALLQHATTRIVYDLDRFRRTQAANPADKTKWLPSYAATLVRETHDSDPPPLGLKIQISFSYSDGFGREIQKKIQAEPEKVNGVVGPPRWVGSGWTIFNNKGKPVRQYEPFFSRLPPAERHHFEFGVIEGVSPVLFYDPAERVIATLHPSDTYEKVVFDPWQQTTYDVNDTVAARAAGTQTGDPRTDPNVQGYVKEYFKALPVDPAHPWQTWYEQRRTGSLGPHEQAAAAKAEVHADTPTTAYFDALGRPFLTLARNRVVCINHPLDGTEAQFANRVELDIEGNQRSVRDAIVQAGDAQGRIVIRYDYDILGNRIHQLSMEAGARWMLNDVAGKSIRVWDSRGHNFTTRYDSLRRPVEQTVRGTTPNSDPRVINRDIVFDKIEYGESVANAEAMNLRTRIHRHLDSAGEVVNSGTNPNTAELEAYDFKGNLRRNSRRLIKLYKEIPDWSQDPGPQLDAERFEGSTRYDALNRPIQSVAPHSDLARAKRNIIQPVFNEANLLERLEVWLDWMNPGPNNLPEPDGLLDPGQHAPSPVGVADIDYDAKGQRLRIDYKNGASTFYEYDPLTFRLLHLLTKRDAAAFPDDCPQIPPTDWPGCQVQNLHYTYDPVGNITHIQDDAQQTIYFKNKRVEPSNDYTYDALHRLIQATGREHLGQGGASVPHSYNDAGRVGLLSADAAGRFAPNDGNAMGTYVERYVYDAVGNFLQMQHRGTDPAHAGWTRAYDYLEASLIEDGGGSPLKTSNRLTSTDLDPAGNTTQPETYEHDGHGNMLSMPQLQVMQWDWRDQLLMTQRQKVNDEDAEGVVRQGERTWYLYDSAGQRVRKVTELANNGGPKDERIYLGTYEIYRAHSGGNAGLMRETLHIMDDKQRIALIETRNDVDDGTPKQLIRYQFGNHLGSASLELDEQAQIISYEEYAAYGSTTYQAVRSRTETAKRYRYAGKERDDETGLMHGGARYFATWLGRWTCCDPAHIADGTNLYCYVHSRPTVFIDPSGLEGEKPPANSVNDVAQFEAREAAFEAGKKLETGQVKATAGGKDLPPPTGKQLEKMVGNSKSAKRLRLKYSTKQGVEAGQRLKVNVTDRSAASASGSKKVANFGEASQKLVPEVGFKKGRVISVGKNPGGEPAGARTADLGIAKEPTPPWEYPALKGQKGSAAFESALDLKLGEGKIENKPGFKSTSGIAAEELTPGTQKLRLPKGSGTSLNVAGGALSVLDAAVMARDQKIAQQEGKRFARARLEDAGGEYVISIRYGLIFDDYSKTYINGPMAGTTRELGFFDTILEGEKRNKEYGYFDWKGDLVPGRVPPVILPPNSI